MKKNNPKKNKHLTYEDSKEIEECLGKGRAFKHIARHIMKDPTTVLYEVKRHRTEYRNSYTRTEEPCQKLLKAPSSVMAARKALLRRLEKYRDSRLLFLRRFDVPFDNNMSERDLRKVKNRQKMSGGFRDESGRDMF